MHLAITSSTLLFVCGIANAVHHVDPKTPTTLDRMRFKRHVNNELLYAYRYRVPYDEPTSAVVDYAYDVAPRPYAAPGTFWDVRDEFPLSPNAAPPRPVVDPYLVYRMLAQHHAHAPAANRDGNVDVHLTVNLALGRGPSDVVTTTSVPDTATATDPATSAPAESASADPETWGVVDVNELPEADTTTSAPTESTSVDPATGGGVDDDDDDDESSGADTATSVPAESASADPEMGGGVDDVDEFPEADTTTSAPAESASADPETGGGVDVDEIPEANTTTNAPAESASADPAAGEDDYESKESTSMEGINRYYFWRLNGYVSR